MKTLPLWDASDRSLITICLVGAILLYTLYGAVWRLYFSPIAHFPGPRFAALTFWNEFYYDVVLGGRYTWKLLDYHEKYGMILTRHSAINLTVCPI